MQVASEVLESNKDMLEEESYNNFKKELDDCSLVLSNDESTQAKVDETLAHLNAYLDDNTNFVYKVVTLEEKVAPKVETSNELLVQTPVVQEQPQVVAPTVEKMAELHPEVHFYKVDIDEDMDLATRFKVMSVPTLLYFRRGVVANKTIGVISASEMEQAIAKAK